MKNQPKSTKRFCVFHANKLPRGCVYPELTNSNYTLVAVVEAEDIDDVFRITNSINSHWSKNPEVKWVMGCENRSTSVGDLVRDGDKLFRCASIGWEEIKL